MAMFGAERTKLEFGTSGASLCSVGTDAGASSGGGGGRCEQKEDKLMVRYVSVGHRMTLVRKGYSVLTRGDSR